MRDERFIAEHRGGTLTRVNHQKLIRWARKCSEHVLPLVVEDTRKLLMNILFTAEEWAKGNVKTGEAMKASLSAHHVARGSSDPVSIAVARSVGQAVATAHMADHSFGAAWYALKAVKQAGKSVDAERKWQNEQLPPEIRDLVLMAEYKG
jgi:hypothetical protein